MTWEIEFLEEAENEEIDMGCNRYQKRKNYGNFY